MTIRNPYEIVKRRHVTEKAAKLGELKSAETSKSLKRFKLPKYVFIVDRDANKQEIREAVEQIYEANGIKVVSVNTINIKAKARRVRGREGFKAAFKKAIVTLEEGDSLDNV
jgi:large subunit ribosomal protein L23